MSEDSITAGDQEVSVTRRWVIYAGAIYIALSFTAGAMDELVFTAARLSEVEPLFYSIAVFNFVASAIGGYAIEYTRQHYRLAEVESHA